jgi:hypothetical protein
MTTFLTGARRVAAHASTMLALPLCRLGAIACIAALAACAHKPPTPVPEEAAHPRSVAIIPVMPSEEISLARGSLPGLLALAERADRKDKQKEFETRFGPDGKRMGDLLTASLLAAAKRRGYDAVVLTDLARRADHPDDFEYPEIATTADVVIHVRLTVLGVNAHRLDSDYEPVVETKAVLVGHRSGYELLSETFAYGEGQNGKDFYSVIGDPADRWTDFGMVMGIPKSVEESWSKGIDAIAVRIIQQLPRTTAPR